MNHLSYDPSRTALLRRQFSAEMRKRFFQLRQAVYRYVATEDTLALTANAVRSVAVRHKLTGEVIRARTIGEAMEEAFRKYGMDDADQWEAGVLDEWDRFNASPTANAPKQFAFLTRPQKARQFQRWLQQQINQKILDVHPVHGEPKGMKPWLYKYVQSAYKKGVTRSYLSTHPELGKPAPWYEGTRAGFLESSFGRPERIDKLELLYTRAYENLKGVTASMSTKMSQILTSGMAHGTSPVNMAKEMSREITKLTKQRALAIATTETIHAHAEGQLDALEDLGVEEVEAEVEFTTSGDNIVCPKCEALAGRRYTISKAHGIIPVHPRCRCSWSPVARAGPKLKKSSKLAKMLR